MTSGPRATARLAIFLGSFAISSAAAALAWALWPGPRLDPSVSIVGDGVLAPHYEARNRYYVYPPLTRFTRTSESGESVEVSTDEHGLRNPKQSLSAAQLIVLGDSFASATNTPRESTFAADLERLVGRRVYNAGVDGFSTFQETRLLRDMLLAGARPSVTVLLFFLGNDFRDNLLDDLPRSKAGWLVNGRVAQAMSYEVQPSETMLRAYHRTGEALAALKALCVENKIPLVVAGVPSRAEVVQSVDDRAFSLGVAWRDHVECTNCEAPEISFDVSDFRLGKILAAGSVEYVSLLRPFRDHKSEELYNERDPHWTPRGQELAAELVAARLRPIIER